MFRFAPHALLLGALLSTTACGDDADTPTTPTAPTTPTTITETFSGSINRNGAATHTFLAQASGTVTVTLTTLSAGTDAIGLSLGTWNGTSCQLVIANTNAVQGVIIPGIASSAGNLCVLVHDVGKIAAAASYEITVVHP
jgi:hypothetical protein